jgi:hypothetical protein
MFPSDFFKTNENNNNINNNLNSEPGSRTGRCNKVINSDSNFYDPDVQPKRQFSGKESKKIILDWKERDADLEDDEKLLSLLKGKKSESKMQAFGSLGYNTSKIKNSYY